MIPRVNVRRAASEATIVVAAVKRHLDGVTPTKRPSTQRSEGRREEANVQDRTGRNLHAHNRRQVEPVSAGRAGAGGAP
jgi:hypothetical protein